MERKDNMIDEIVAESKTNNSKKEFNKEEWAKKKTEERNEVYSLIDKTALEVIKDKDKFKDYLDKVILISIQLQMVF